MTLDRLWAGWRAEYIEDVAGSVPERVAGSVPERVAGSVPERQAGEPRGDACLFCRLAEADDEEGLVLARTEHAFAVMNAYPYTSGHLMVSPLRHEGTLAGLGRDEAAALMALTQDATVALQAAYRPDGMNVGVNLGRAGGAGIPGHVHVHVLPRWNGDTNFMTAVAETRVLPESLRTSFDKLRASWPA